jgi:hypothetical protein
MTVSALAKPSNDTGVRWPSVPTEQHDFPGDQRQTVLVRLQTPGWKHRMSGAMSLGVS